MNTTSQDDKPIFVSVKYFESVSGNMIIRYITNYPTVLSYLMSPSVSVMFPYFCFINSRNSGNSMVPLPSRSASIMRLRTSSSVGFSPMALITWSSSLVEILPLPSCHKLRSAVRYLMIQHNTSQIALRLIRLKPGW